MEYLSVDFQSLGASVDREEKVLRGYVMAMEGDFVDGRGAFSRDSLKAIVDTVNKQPKGLKSRWGHPSIFGDGLGNLLGRARSARMDTTLNREGRRVAAARGDLHLDPSSFNTPNGDLGSYLMTLAESDPDAVSSSLVIWPQIEERGKGLTPVWFPKELKASDIVEEGAAVSSLLEPFSRNRLREQLDRWFQDLPPGEVDALLTEYLASRAGPKPETPRLDAKRIRLEEMALAMRKMVLSK